jgi:hypothetical protein
MAKPSAVSLVVARIDADIANLQKEINKLEGMRSYVLHRGVETDPSAKSKRTRGPNKPKPSPVSATTENQQ